MKLQQFLDEFPGLAAILGAAIFSLCFMAVEFGLSTEQVVEGEIIAFQYKPESVSTNPYTYRDQNGTTHTYHQPIKSPEKHILIVQKSDGEVVKVRASLQTRYTVSERDVITFTVSRGYFTRAVLSRTTE